MGPNVWFNIWDEKWVLEWGFPIRKRLFDTEKEARAAAREVFDEHMESMRMRKAVCGFLAKLGGRHMA